MPASYMTKQSAAAYQQVVTESKLSTDHQSQAQLDRVGKRISSAVERFMLQNGMEDRVEDFSWEFVLIEDDTPNAWCMPGGKVAFYTGILPFTKDEAGMAVVMGHEVAHAVARHSGERMSYQLAQQGGGSLLAWSMEDSEWQEATMALYGVGTQYGAILPFSRMHESEADRLGLIFMAMAGYDPAAAVEFWQRMSAGGGGAPIELMSTHPSDKTRIEN